MAPTSDSTDILPSQNIYDEFNKDGRTCNGGSGVQGCSGWEREEDVRSTLGNNIYLKAAKLANKVMRNWCYVHNDMKADPTLTKEQRCNFFYFWLGDKIKNENFTGGITLMNAMVNIYTQLHRFKCKEDCPKVYYDISSVNIFNWAKDLWDFEYNKEKLRGKEKDQECSTYKQGQNYQELLTKAKKAYSDLCSNCGSVGGQYCGKFRVKYGDSSNNNKCKKDWPPTGLEPLTCHSEIEKVEQEEEVPEGVPDLTGERDLGKLPSQVLYKKFENKEGLDKCNGGTVQNLKPQLDQELGGYEIGQVDVNTIIAPWCYVTKKMTDEVDQLYRERFNFFYLWVGYELLERSTKSVSFGPLMRQIYQKLKTMGDGQECDQLCDGLYLNKEEGGEKNTFEHIKTLAEYFADYATLNSYLGNNGNKKCDATYYGHLKQIEEACKTIKEGCRKENGAHKSEEYCKWFNEHQHKSYCDNGALSKLKCTKVKPPNPNPNQAGSSGSLSDGVGEQHSGVSGGSDGGGSHRKEGEETDNSVLGAVGGGLVSVALPTIGFFLYKYTDVFDGIKKSLFGGSNNTGGRNRGRGRRSTVRHTDHFNGFDSSTMGDDSSTLGGGGGGSSTLGGSSTDISTIYNDDEPPRRPSSPPSRKPYHTRQNRNIRYQNM
ncbi:KIR protein [Plasmodium knowlesi strain H]|uniref:KIR protein n=3 Tax=Plasmodium knowlesi TaxID=5850 RepID=A0A5K1URM3_PLAKH|nr:KIR protein [Plasmodium knowlesi strain H]OTN68430.1 KIR protein [Plasmodium knowlesi]CAA9986641.1 KIR protein [Plasmodium knowlesi strain H]SBO24076.1 KIR protein [Plasmodium knowlesi strain H]SBO29351.1 KIR protein [Plasmodium knowlesi strain H]VVS76115.1 KIR protein [Plasmodium knowlesi strain H]|eukprot:XP_002261181.1 KIR protein [Plasmodium knowlesi strain H]